MGYNITANSIAMERKWASRSDTILMAMVILWFVGAIWGMTIVSLQFVVQALQTFQSMQNTSGYYGYGGYGATIDINSVLLYIGAPVTGGIVTWLLKNLAENISKHKHDSDKNNTTEQDTESESVDAEAYTEPLNTEQ